MIYLADGTITFMMGGKVNDPNRHHLTEGDDQDQQPHPIFNLFLSPRVRAYNEWHVQIQRRDIQSTNASHLALEKTMLVLGRVSCLSHIIACTI